MLHSWNIQAICNSDGVEPSAIIINGKDKGAYALNSPPLPWFVPKATTDGVDWLDFLKAVLEGRHGAGCMGIDPDHDGIGVEAHPCGIASLSDTCHQLEDA